MTFRKDSREYLARILRDFISGKITNREMIDQFDEIPDGDSAVDEIVNNMTFLYDDALRIVRLEGGTGADKQDVEIILRCLTFLDGTLEFQKPNRSISIQTRDLLQKVLYASTFGILGERFGVFEEEQNFWPYSKEQFQNPESTEESKG